jgi:ankyrin repeat protein
MPLLVAVCIESAVKGSYPIHWAAVAVNGTPITDQVHPLSALRALLAFEDSPDRPNINGASAMHLISTQKASTQERFQILANAIEMLVQKGADLNLFDRGGNAPLHLASRFNDLHNEVL